ncbi:unnamed protein product, partial [Closterium sp. Naga37s-1]
AAHEGIAGALNAALPASLPVYVQGSSDLPTNNAVFRIFSPFKYSPQYTSIAVGSPARAVVVMLDTLSSLSWLLCHCGPSCPAPSHILQNRTVFEPSSSATSRPVPCNSPSCPQASMFSCNSSSSTGAAPTPSTPLSSSPASAPGAAAAATAAAGGVCTFNPSNGSAAGGSAGPLISDLLSLLSTNSSLRRARVTFGSRYYLNVTQVRVGSTPLPASAALGSTRADARGGVVVDTTFPYLALRPPLLQQLVDLVFSHPHLVRQDVDGFACASLPTSKATNETFPPVLLDFPDTTYYVHPSTYLMLDGATAANLLLCLAAVPLPDESVHDAYLGTLDAYICAPLSPTPSLPPSLPPAPSPSLTPSLSPFLSPSSPPSLPPPLLPSFLPSFPPSSPPSLPPPVNPSLPFPAHPCMGSTMASRPLPVVRTCVSEAAL